MSEQEKSLQTILGEALDIADAQERATYLSRACGTNPALRRDVEELIAAHAAASKFLPERPAEAQARPTLPNPDTTTVQGGPASSFPVREKAGDRIGRY